MRAINKLISLSILLLLLTGLAQANEPYQPAGATSTPRIEARWNYYRDYQQATGLLEALADEFPELCRLQSIGQSYGGREMWVMTITDFSIGEESEKPAFWIDGGIHANELQGTDVVLYTTWYLLEMHEHSEFIQQLLRERVFYILPMLSPDSRDAHFYEPNSSSSPRSGQRPVDDDRDGLFDEDGADDINGDGHISRMRKRDPNGNYRESEDYPGQMERVGEDEQGDYLMLGSEGIDNDGDGRVNEDGDGSYDPNRDWAWSWQPGYVEWGSYRYPFSIIENRLAADFMAAHPNIAGAQSYHNTGGMFLRGPGDPDSPYPYDDVALYDELGKRGEELVPGYKYSVTSEDLYEAYGVSKDWVYQMQGVLAFTTELGTSFNYFRQENTSGWFGSREEAWKFNEYLLFGDGIVPWEEYEHPVYGTVEIGGSKKTWGRQPASFLLEEECHRNMAFTLYHASEMPQVKVQSVEVKELAGGVTQLTAIVVNDKLTPTHTRVDLNHRITRPDYVTLEGIGFTVLASYYSDSVFFENIREMDKNPERVELTRLGSYDLRYVRWLIKGDLPAAVRIDSVKGGVHRLEVE